MDHFIVDDLSKAEWTVRKINDKQSQLTALDNAAKSMKLAYSQQVDQWLEKESDDLQTEIDNLSALLRPFVESQLADKKKKSINLPSGKAGFSKQQPQFFISDQKVDGKSDQLLQLVKSHNLNFIVTNEYVDWASFKKSLTITDDNKVVTKDGEILEELTVKVEPDKFYVKSR